MNCAYCNEKITSPVKQGNDMFCSLECANLAAGYDTSEEEDSYFEEDALMEDIEDYEE